MGEELTPREVIRPFQIKCAVWVTSLIPLMVSVKKPFRFIFINNSCGFFFFFFFFGVCDFSPPSLVPFAKISDSNCTIYLERPNIKYQQSVYYRIWLVSEREIYYSPKLIYQGPPSMIWRAGGKLKNGFIFSLGQLLDIFPQGGPLRNFPGEVHSIFEPTCAFCTVRSYAPLSVCMSV